MSDRSQSLYLLSFVLFELASSHSLVLYNSPIIFNYHYYPSMDVLHSNQLDSGDTIYYSLVQKQSQKGFSTNKRLLLMLEGHFISYLSQPNLHFTFTKDYISKHAKMIVPLVQINKVIDRHQDKKIIIHFWIYEKQKRVEKVWNLRFGNLELLQRWMEKFQEETNRSRKGTGSISIRQDGNQSNLESAQKLIRRLSRQDNMPDGNRPQLGTQPPSNFQTQPQPYNPNPQDINPAYSRNFPQPTNINDSYFSNAAFTTPMPSKQPGQTYQQALIIQNSKMKDRSIYFSNNSFSTAKKHNFKNYYRPYLDSIVKNPNNMAKGSQLAQASAKFDRFLEYSKQCVVTLVQEKLEKLKELQRLKDIKSRIKEDTPNWIRFTQFDDVSIQLGLIELKNVKNDNYICDAALTKIAMNNHKNLEYLYEVIGRDLALINTFYIPMACVVTYKGYTCFVTSKIIPDQDQQDDGQPSDLKETSIMFDRLSTMSKIGFQVFQNQNFIKFTPKNQRKDKFIINYAKTYLPQLQNCLTIRKESFAAIYPQYQPQNYIYLVSKKESQYQTGKITRYLQQKIVELSDLMNKLEVYPISPMEMSEILHCFGINVKYLSHLYNRITQFYVQSVIKTDAALRVFKMIFSKKLQENLGKNRRNLAEQTGKELLNILLGKQEASDQLWKVVSLHSQMYFNLSIDQAQINKGYLLLGLNHYLSIEIFANYPNIQKVFKAPNFVQALRFHAKVKPPHILPTFMKGYEQEHDISMNSSLFQKTISAFDLEDQPLPSFLTHYRYIHSKVLYLLSFNIDPRDNRYRHLKLYEPQTISQYETMTSLNFFTLQRQMTQAKWQIKNNAKPDYILMLTNKLKDTIQNHYGKTHPFISQIYQLQSLYFLQLFQEQQSIQINKESLSNMIQCCGNNNRHLKISNNYYQLGECLKKCYRFQEAVLNYKKAKNILEINSYQNLPEYAHLLYKLGVMYLLMNRDAESYEIFMHAISIYQQSDIYSHWDALVDLYEAIHRCQLKPNNKSSVILSDVKLAEHCVVQLEKILIVEIEFQICSDSQFIRLFKIIAEQYINCIKRDDRIMFRDYILELCDYFSINPEPQSQHSTSRSIIYFKSLISNGKFCELILAYMIQTNEILLRLKNDKRVGRLIPSRRNELIQNYDEFMKNMVVILGEPFVLNII